MIGSKFVDLLIAPFGLARVVLGCWPHREIIEAAAAAIGDMGGDLVRTSGSPAR